MSANKLKQIRERLNLSQSEFYEKTGLQQSTVSLMESGARPIGKRVQETIIRSLNVNPRWWNTGTGEMFVTEKKTIPVYLFDNIEGIAVESVDPKSFTDCDRIIEYNGESFGKIISGSQLLLKLVTAESSAVGSYLVVVMTKGETVIGSLESSTSDTLILQKDSTPFTVKKRGIKMIFRVEWVVVKA